LAEENNNSNLDWIQFTIREIRIQGKVVDGLKPVELPRDADASKDIIPRGFTDSKLRSFVQAMGKKGGGSPSEITSWKAPPGELVFSPDDQMDKWGAIAYPLKNGNMISLDLYSPKRIGDHLQSAESHIPTISVFVKDGDFIALAEKESDDSTRLIFVHAVRIDSKGIPLDSSNRILVPYDPTGRIHYSFRRPPLIEAADELALAGSKDLADGNYESGKANYELALWVLPPQATLDPRRKAYQKQLDRVMELNSSLQENP